MKKGSKLDYFPEIMEDSAYIYGVLVKERHNQIFGSFNQDLDGLKPIGGVLQLGSTTFFNNKKYLTEIFSLLNSLRTHQSEPFYSQEEILEILKHEELADYDRGGNAPYFRCLVFSWIKKTGLYPIKIKYIGNVPGEDKILTKHFFHVQECLTFRKGKPMYINFSSKESYQFDRSLAREEEICMHPIKDYKFGILFQKDVKGR